MAAQAVGAVLSAAIKLLISISINAGVESVWKPPADGCAATLPGGADRTKKMRLEVLASRGYLMQCA
jgi:hypothetical protein